MFLNFLNSDVRSHVVAICKKKNSLLKAKVKYFMQDVFYKNIDSCSLRITF